MDPSQPSKEPAIKLHLDDFLSAKRFPCFSAAIFSILGLIFIIASNVPSSIILRKRTPAEALESIYNNLGYELEPYNLDTNPVFSVQVDELRTLNKFVALELTSLNVKDTSYTSIDLQVEVSVLHIKGIGLENTIVKKDLRKVTFTCDFSQGLPCTTEEIIQTPTLDGKNIYFVVKILNSEELSNIVDEFLIQSVTLNIPYRIYLFITKLVLVIVTVVCVLWHTAKMRNLGKEFFTREQKVFLFVAPALITINEPFTIYLLEGNFYTWSTIVNFLVFSSLLTWYWLSTIQDLAGTDSSRIEKSSKFAKVFAIIYFIVAFLTYITLGNASLDKGTFDFDSTHSPMFEFFKIALYITQLIALAWIAVKTWRIFQRLNELTEREQTYFLFSTFFILFHFYMVSKGGLFIFSYDGCRVILFCAVSTLYVFTTTYLYLPTKEGLAAAQHIKKYDNPALKNKYKDLEDSGYHTPKKESKAIESTGKLADDLEKEQQYPYEKKEEEEL